MLAGDTSGFHDYLQDEILELGLKGRVVLAGYVAAEDPAPALRGRPRLHLSSRSTRASGLPLLEAMACGTPVLAAGNSSVPEVVERPPCSPIPWTPSAMAGCLTRLAADEALRRQLTERGIERAARFTWEGAAQRVLNLYGQVLAGGGGGH